MLGDTLRNQSGPVWHSGSGLVGNILAGAGMPVRFLCFHVLVLWKLWQLRTCITAAKTPNQRCYAVLCHSELHGHPRVLSYCIICALDQLWRPY
jgi:hypothetical protein